MLREHFYYTERGMQSREQLNAHLTEFSFLG